MPAESQDCDDVRIEQFLSAELSEAELSDVEQHVEHCDTCRQRLLTTAAGAKWWEDANEFLTSDPHDLDLKDGDALSGVVDRGNVVTSDNIGEDTGDGFTTDIRQIVAWLGPTDDPAMLGRIGTYEIAGVIGAGGMGVVLKGFDRALNRFVAIKILGPHLATSGAARQRFAREAQAAAAVVHDNVVAIHGVDESNDLPYLVMPYLRGTSLQRRIDKNGSLSVSEVLRISLQTARGLAAAHEQGLVHRDIKPANILMDGTTERVLITDFGLARAADDASLTHSGVIAGTPYYMSPEQADGSGIDHRSDLFSLGSVMYAMCTGRPPFRAETSWGILKRVNESTPRPIRELNPDVPTWLANIISELHEKQSSNRIQSASELADLLEQCLAHVQQPTRHQLPARVAELVQRQNVGRAGGHWLANSLLVVCILFLVGSGLIRLGRFLLDGRTEPVVAMSLEDVQQTELEIEDLKQTVDVAESRSSDFWGDWNDFPRRESNGESTPQPLESF